MRHIAFALAFMLASPALAQQQPERPLVLNVLMSDYKVIWDALGEQKAKDVFNLMVKLNNQIVPQLSMPPIPPAPPAPPETKE